MFLVLFPPSLHKCTRTRVDNRSNVVTNILLLPKFVLKGDCLRSEWLECVADVDLWTTCNTDTKVRKSKADEVRYKIKDLFTGRGDIRRIGTFIKGVHDKINSSLIWKSE